MGYSRRKDLLCPGDWVAYKSVPFGDGLEMNNNNNNRLDTTCCLANGVESDAVTDKYIWGKDKRQNARKIYNHIIFLFFFCGASNGSSPQEHWTFIKTSSQPSSPYANFLHPTNVQGTNRGVPRRQPQLATNPTQRKMQPIPFPSHHPNTINHRHNLILSLLLPLLLLSLPLFKPMDKKTPWLQYILHKHLPSQFNLLYNY